MKRRHPLSLVLVAAGLAACAEPIAPPVEILDEAAVAQFAETVSESSDVRLPYLGALLKAARAAIEEQGGNEEAVAHFRRARHLANAAEDAREAGNTEEADDLDQRSYRQKLAGIISALGPEAATTAVAGSAAGLARILSHLDGRVAPDRVLNAVTRIQARVGYAEARLAAGEFVPALHQALKAADEIRHLAPRYVAGKWIGRATRLLRSAREAVGDAPTDDEATAIRRARRLLNLAKDEAEAGHWGKAVNLAARSATLSWGVIEGRSG